MARTTITVETVSRTAVAIGSGEGAADANGVSNGYDFTNDGDTLLVIFNSGATERNVTVVTQSTVDGAAVADKAYVIAASKHYIVGPFPPGVYNTGGMVQFTSDHLELQFQAIRVS